MPIVPEQRLLAAVVFTDVSGFSARMQLEESAVLQLIERDFAAMREFSKELSGTVLKTTGDGLLLYFTSGVQAVTWALHTQRYFVDKARGRPPTETLRHRIGVHIGDIFVRADDVMGDGVNIAARVQAEAPPGGICISQTVYDVVKNKMDLRVVRLEPRRLKNIRELIQMYHVLLDEPTAPVATTSMPSVQAPVALPSRPVEPRPRRILPKLVLLAALIGGSVWMVKKVSELETGLADGDKTRNELGQLLEKEKDPPVATTPGAGNAPQGVDFAKLTTNSPPAAPRDAAEQQVMQEAIEARKSLDVWLKSELPRYTRDSPLKSRPLFGGEADNVLYVDHTGMLWFVKGRAFRPRPWEELKPDEQGAIIVSVVNRASPPAAIVRGAEAFAYLHGLPQMTASLQRPTP